MSDGEAASGVLIPDPAGAVLRPVGDPADPRSSDRWRTRIRMTSVRERGAQASRAAVAETLLTMLSGKEPASQLPATMTEVVVRAGAHGALDAIAGSLLRRDDLSGEDGDTVSQGRFITTARHLHLVSRLRSISDAFGRSGIPWVVFKGPVLAVEAYGNPSLRRYGDIDILVTGSHFGQAVDALVAVGGRLLDTNWSYQLRAGRAEASLLMPGGLHIDLHWHLCNERGVRTDTDLPIEAMLARRRQLSVAPGVDLPTFDRVDTFLATALHAGINGAHRLLWIKDVERLAASTSESEWQQLVRRCRDGRVAVPVALALLRSRRLLGAQVPDGVLEGLLAGHPWTAVLRRRESTAEPVSIVYQHHTGRSAIAAARDGLFPTARAAAAELARKARSDAVTRDGNPLAAGVEDPAAREAYLRAVADSRI